MTISIARLTSMKNQVDDAKTKKAEATGELRGLMKQLLDDFGAATLDEAKAKHKDLLAEEDEVVQEIEELTAQLEESYDWS